MKRPCNILIIVRASDGQQMWYAGVLPAANSVGDATRSQVHVEQQEGAFRPILTENYQTMMAASPPPALKINVTLAHQRTQAVGPVPTKILDAFLQGDAPIPVPPRTVTTREGDSFTVDDWPTESELELLVRQQTANIIGAHHARRRSAAKKGGKKR